jgi:hypothetical protein
MKVFRTKPTGRPPTDPAVRFWPKVDKNGPGGCWLWLGTVAKDGYGRFWVRSKKRRAHAVAYELAVGPVPAGLVLDHVRARGCTHRHCVNPAHLEPVTTVENTMRGDAPAARAARATHCPKGHPYAGDNLYIQPSNGSRLCRECNRQHARAVRAARAA